MIDPTPDLPGANRSHHWLAAAISSAIIFVWGIEVAVVVNVTSVTDAQAGTMVSVFSPADERVAMAAIRAAGAGQIVAYPAAGTWVVHAKEAGFAERLRDEGMLGVFEKLRVCAPGRVGCFLLPSGRYALFAS